MKNILTKNVEGIEYLKIKEIVEKDMAYFIFIDIETKSKVIVSDINLEVIKDEKVLKNVLKKVFSKNRNGIYSYKDCKQSEKEKTDLENKEDIFTLEYPPAEAKKMLKVLKEMFFKKFGKDVISEEELDKRIKKYIKKIYISSDDKNFKDDKNCFGMYTNETKTITLKAQNRDINKIPDKSIAFHEFTHGVIPEGAIKEITIYNVEESYVYGEGINEGIVSYIQYMENSKYYQKFQTKYSYDGRRRVVHLLKPLYENISGENFIDQYAKKPSETLERINDIFREDAKRKNPEISDRELDLISMRESLNFILEVDELDRDDNPFQKFNENLETKLINLFIGQISNKKVKNINELYHMLYQIEGFKLNLSKNDSKEILEELKTEKINEFLKEHPISKLNTLIEKIPKLMEDSYCCYEEKMLIAIFGGEEKPDLRYFGIRKSLQKLQEKRNIEGTMNYKTFENISSINTKKPIDRDRER